jgi:nucleoside-diphosphate-sugar epimerase
VRALVLGGTGVISRAIVSELLTANYEVTILTRGQAPSSHSSSVEWLKLDRSDHKRFAALFGSRRFDAVIDMICFTASDADQTLSVFGDSSPRILIASSVAAYRRPLNTVPTREDAEQLWVDPTFPYGYRKAEMERYLQDRIADGARVTIVRPSLTFGPGARNVGVLRQNMGILERIRTGKPLLMFGDGTVPWGFAFSSDVARGMVGLLASDGAAGAAVHIASEESCEWKDLYAAFGRMAGREPDLEYLPARTLWQADPDRFDHLYFEKSHPGLFDMSRFRELVPDFRMTTSLDAGLEALVQSWIDDGLAPDPALGRLEDKLVATARECTAAVRRDLMSRP